MKTWRIGILFAFVAIVGCMSVARPEWLGENRFLDQIMSHELIAILVVILTVTFASVANIHLAITRIAASSGLSPDEQERKTAPVRAEINSNAWFIFWAFVVGILALVWKGFFPENMHVLSGAHAIGLTVLLVNVLVLHDIYRAIFALLSSRTAAGRSGSGDGQDYTEESPRAG